MQKNTTFFFGEGVKHQIYWNVVTFFANKSTQYFNEKDMTKIKLQKIREVEQPNCFFLYGDYDYGKIATMADWCVKHHFHQFFWGRILLQQ